VSDKLQFAGDSDSEHQTDSEAQADKLKHVGHSVSTTDTNYVDILSRLSASSCRGTSTGED